MFPAPLPFPFGELLPPLSGKLIMLRGGVVKEKEKKSVKFD